MKTWIPKLALAGLCTLSAGLAAAGVSVVYAAPQNFADVGWSEYDRNMVLKDLSEHFGKLAARLPEGTDMKVEVLDIDLAGRLRHSFRWPNEIRVLSGGADWPHIHLRYTIERDGQVVASGEDHLQNMMYLERINRYSSGDTLRYEKQMVDDWFKQHIAAAVATR